MSAVELNYYSHLRNDPNLVAYYRLEDNTNDSKGAYSGSPVSISYGLNYGKFNKGALITSASGSRIQIDSLASIFSDRKPHTIMFWFKASNNGYMFSVNVDLSSGGRGYRENASFAANGNIVYSRTPAGDDGPNAQTTTNAHNYFDGNWHLVAFTYDGNKIGITTEYESVESISTTSNGNIALFQICQFINGNSRQFGAHFGGNIDDISIFSRALTASEVSNYYKNSIKSNFLAFLM